MIISSPASALALLLLAAPGQHYRAPATAQDDRPYSDAVRAGDTLYLAGMIGTDPATRALASGGFEAEARQAMVNIGRTLAAHRLTHDDLVKCTVLLADIGDWGRLNPIYRSFFKPGRYPARTAVAVAALPGGARVEIDCIAHFPAGR